MWPSGGFSLTCLFYFRNNLRDKSFLHTQIVRKEKYFFQLSGNISLYKILSDSNISGKLMLKLISETFLTNKGYNDKELHKICLDEEEEEDVSCDSAPISNLTEVIQVMKSSWISRSHCVNVELAGDNKFLLLPSITDDYFTEREEADVVGVVDVRERERPGYQDWSDLINATQLGRNNRRLGRRNNKGNTFLFSLSPLLLTARLRSDMARAPHLYLSTFLSAALKDNTDCVEYLQTGGLHFTEDQCFTALGESDTLSSVSSLSSHHVSYNDISMAGLTENPWASPCITDLSHHVVKQIFEANSSVQS